MDINSLLSPQIDSSDPPPSKSSSSSLPGQSVLVFNGDSKRKRSLRKDDPEGTHPTSPTSHANPPPAPALPRPALTINQSNRSPSLTSASTLASTRSISSALSTPTRELRPNVPVGSPPAIRRSSTEKMEFLADLASMQQPQSTSAPTSRNVRNAVAQSPAMSPLMTSLPSSRKNSIIPSPSDMGDAPRPIVPPRSFDAPSLSSQELQQITSLTKQLAETTYLHESHIKLVGLLHKGLIQHIKPPNSSTEIFSDPQSYPLLIELRQARDAMTSRFPLGEEGWIHWIQDECMLARTVDERIAVIELCGKALREEVGSTRLWRLYAEWMWYLFKVTRNLEQTFESIMLEQDPIVGGVLAMKRWTSDEKVVGQQVFTWDGMLDVWRDGVEATQWHLNDSHTIWNPYVEVLAQNLANEPSQEKIDEVLGIFSQRLQQPHVTWDETFQKFSTFVSTYCNDKYESIMSTTNKQAAQAKLEFSNRESYETSLQQAFDNQNSELERSIMSTYLEWEHGQLQKKNGPPYGMNLFRALLERANLRFSLDIEFWEDHVDLMLSLPNVTSEMLAVTERSVRHCPWSGNLWSKRLCALEVSQKSFEELEDAKHRATGTGLLEAVGNMDELIKVYSAWCGFLRRRAFDYESGEDERDIAEVGIRSSIENIREIGEKKYGRDFKGDPQFRVERIYAKFLSQMGRDDEGRRMIASLIPTHGDNSEFWHSWYLYEMTLWGKARGISRSSGKVPPYPEHATSVLQQAVRWQSVDWPEKLLGMYLHHCAQHESVKKLQEAHVEVRSIQKAVNARRLKEHNDAVAVQQAQASEGPRFQHYVPMRNESQGQEYGNPKRKRDEDQGNMPNTKRNKMVPSEPEVISEASENAALPEVEAAPEVKRDREHLTLLVTNLPSSITETKLRKFFKECGTLLNVHIMRKDTTNDVEHAEELLQATVEFESEEDALSGLTRHMKMIDGESVNVHRGTRTTLWVTNYPPEADEAFIRNLFGPYGDIVEVRFPSLKFDTHRRFCYVQFLTSSEASSAATALDGKKLDGGFVLSAKISDPAAKKARSGATEEGREIYISNVDWSATEEEVKQLFNECGTIERVRIPRNLAGKSKGIAFIVFATSDEAEEATKMNSSTFRDRILSVSISRPKAKGAKRSATNIVHSASPDADSSGQRVTSPMELEQSPAPSSVTNADNRGSGQDHKSRTLRLTNIPDTVNDARIRKLAEGYGPLKKITLRPERGEALVEFEHIEDTGKAELGLQGYEIAEGAVIQVSPLGMRNGSEGPRTGKNVFHQSTGVHRPGQRHGPRRGGKAGLGFTRQGANGIGQGENEQHRGDDAAAVLPKKTNDDFRAMLNGQT